MAIEPSMLEWHNCTLAGNAACRRRSELSITPKHGELRGASALALFAALLFSATTPAAAQAGQEQDAKAETGAARVAAGADASARDDIPAAGDIVVTAQRREQALSKVPVSVSAYSGETLSQRVVTREQDLASLVPGLIIKSGQNTNQVSFTIRGQTLDPFSATSPAVLTYVNEAPFAAGNTSTAFFDFSSLQVLKGPQGTLFGRNATGGAVLYGTTMPGKDFGGYLTVRAGDFHMFQAQGAVDIPVVPDKLLVRIAGDYVTSDGYIRNINTGSTLGDTDSKSGRITVVFTPSDTVKNVTVAQYSDFGGSEGAGGLYSYHQCGSTNNGFALTATMDCVYGMNSPFAPLLGDGPAGPGRWPGATAGYLAWQKQNPYKVWLTYDLPHKAHTAFVTNTTTIEVSDDLTLKNIFSWGDSFARTPGILTGSPFGAIDLFNFSGLGNGPPGGETFANKRWSNELQLQGNAFTNRLKYIVGAFASGAKDNVYIPVVVGPELLGTNFNGGLPLADISETYRTKNRSKAIFAQATYDFMNGLSVTLGGRYTWEKVALKQNPGSVFSIIGPTPAQSKNLSAPSWTFNLQYQISARSMVYFAQRGSFRSGNFSGTTAPFNDLNFFKNEYAHDFELGYKFNGRIIDAPAHFNIAVYQQDVKNAQHAVYALLASGPSGFTVNVPKKRIRGVEVDGDIQIADWLRLGISGAYTDAKFTSNIVDLSGQTGIPGYLITMDSYPDTPKWAGSFYTEVKLPVPESLGQMNLRGDVFKQTSSYFSSNAHSITPRTQLPGYTTVNVRYSWNEIMGSKFSLGLYVKNLFDKFYYQSGYVEGAAGGFNTATPGAPRAFGAEVSVKF